MSGSGPVSEGVSVRAEQGFHLHSVDRCMYPLCSSAGSTAEGQQHCWVCFDIRKLHVTPLLQVLLVGVLGGARRAPWTCSLSVTWRLSVGPRASHDDVKLELALTSDVWRLKLQLHGTVNEQPVSNELDSAHPASCPLTLQEHSLIWPLFL
jgi:hypothetical protein